MATVVTADRLRKRQDVVKGMEQAGDRAVIVPRMGAGMRLGDVMQQKKADLGISFCNSDGAGALMAATKHGYPERHGVRSIEEGVTVINDRKTVLEFGFMDQEKLGKRVIEASIKKHGAQGVVTQKGAVTMGATKQSTQTMIAFGKSNKKNGAFASALNDVSKKVLKETTEVLIRIKPKKVTICQAKEQVYTEKFLFSFFLGKRMIYHVKLTVKVEIQAIAVEEVDFLTEIIKEPNAIIVPFPSKRGV